jgi:hypothetical protein
MQSLVREVIEAVARAEGGTFEEVSPRVWVFPNEVPEGRWVRAVFYAGYTRSLRSYLGKMQAGQLRSD